MGVVGGNTRAKGTKMQAEGLLSFPFSLRCTKIKIKKKEKKLKRFIKTR